MTSEQLYLAIGVPLLFNGVIFLIVVTSFDARIGALENSFNARFTALERIMDAKFEAAHQELLRVEGVLDAPVTNTDPVTPYPHRASKIIQPKMPYRPTGLLIHSLLGDYP